METVSRRVYLPCAGVYIRVGKPLEDKGLGGSRLQGRRVGLLQTITWIDKCTGRTVLDGTVCWVRRRRRLSSQGIGGGFTKFRPELIMKPFRILPLYRGIDEYILNVRLAFDANDFGFQFAGKFRDISPPPVFVVVMGRGECVGHVQNVNAEVVRYALQYTVRDVSSESMHDGVESPCIDCGPNQLSPVFCEDIEQNASQLCQNVPRVGANGIQVVGRGGCCQDSTGAHQEVGDTFQVPRMSILRVG